MLKPTGSKQVIFNWLHLYSVLLPSSGQNIYSVHFYIVFQVIDANCMTSVVNNAQNFSRHRLLLMKWTLWGKRSTFRSRVFTEVGENDPWYTRLRQSEPGTAPGNWLFESWWTSLAPFLSRSKVKVKFIRHLCATDRNSLWESVQGEDLEGSKGRSWKRQVI